MTVVVLAGGRSTRFGADKLGAPLRGSTVLETLLDRLPADAPVVVVGDERPTRRRVVWTSEEPQGGGPLAAVLAGAGLVGTGLVAVVAGDMPDAAPAVDRLVDLLDAADAGVEAVVATDDEGVPNPLLAAYRTASLHARAALPTAGVPARSLLDLPHVEVAVPGAASRDVDTPADLDAFENGV